MAVTFISFEGNIRAVWDSSHIERRLLSYRLLSAVIGRLDQTIASSVNLSIDMIARHLFFILCFGFSCSQCASCLDNSSPMSIILMTLSRTRLQNEVDQLLKLSPS